MKNSTFAGIIVLMAILLALSFSVAFAGNEKVNATKAVNITNATIATPQNCSDLRNCVESCAKIQNCSEYLNCIDNCTINATAFGEAKGVVVVKRNVNLNDTTNSTNPMNETHLPLPIMLPNKPRPPVTPITHPIVGDR